MNAQNQQQLQNAQAQQALANIDASNLPPAQRNLLKNAVAQAHMINSMALHFVEHNNNGLLSPLANIGTTININFSNLNQAVNLGVALPTNLGKMWALRIGPFSSLLRLDQVIAVQQIPKDTLPVNIKVQGIDNVISQISERRGVAACFQGACGGSNLQCIWLEVPLNGPETPGVHGAVIVCRTHAPSFQGNEVLNILAGTEIYLC
ncbi:hypothetical protein BASA82_000558 [Batrachochytrium salamandrivorans]|nr:hypothetical protein BASA81_003586 [Batrachochytrium salamandrivorans]KAH9262391.1 hypothetical protein BASA82_000558 [Batrachochytrium salamandrivorans]